MSTAPAEETIAPSQTPDASGAVLSTSLGDPGKAARSVLVTFKNWSDALLTRKSEHLDHGIWSENLYPPEKIPVGAKNIQWASESSGVATGTEGNVVYSLPDETSTVTVYWDNPFSGGNTFSIKIDGPLAPKYTGTTSGAEHDNNVALLVLFEEK